MERAGATCFAAVALLLATPAPADSGRTDQNAAGPPMVEVRVFEIRRLNSDFTPLEDLSFRIRSDGTAVQVSEWLATLARRIPDAYFAQLLTLGPAPTGPEARWAIARRDPRRAIQIRLVASEPNAAAPATDVSEPRFRLELDLLRSDVSIQRIQMEGPVEPGVTRMVSGRDFELPLSRYLTWFRDPADLEARGALYETIRDRNIYLALAVTFRNPPAQRSLPPVGLRPPPNAELGRLRSPLVGSAEGMLRLRLQMDAVGAVDHIEVLETTLPEVTPRVLGIVSGWRFPQAAGRQGRLSLPVRTAPPATSR